MRKYGLYLLIAVSLMTGCQKKDTVTEDAPAPASDVTAGKPDIFGEAAEDDAE